MTRTTTNKAKVGDGDLEPIEYYTSASINYDGFSTRTLAIVGHDRRNGNPVRLIMTRRRDYEWQTARYDSGCHRWTSARVTFEDYLRFGDWEAFAEPRQVIAQCDGCHEIIMDGDKFIRGPEGMIFCQTCYERDRAQWERDR